MVRIPLRPNRGADGGRPSRGHPRGRGRPPGQQRFQRVRQVKGVFDMTRQADPRLVPWLVGPSLAALVLFVAVGLLLDSPVYFSILGLLAATLVATIIFGRRASKAMYSQVEGQPGAAAAVLQSMRGDWRVTPAVAFNRNQDLVHRVVGRPGIVLVGEGGSPVRVQQLLAQERRRVSRVAADTPMYDVQVGEDNGQVPLRRLQQHFAKLPRNLKGPQVDGLESRLRALGTHQLGIPKGPLPRNVRMPRGKTR